MPPLLLLWAGSDALDRPERRELFESSGNVKALVADPLQFEDVRDVAFFADALGEHFREIKLRKLDLVMGSAVPENINSVIVHVNSPSGLAACVVSFDL
jgi:hypothetical protein